MQWCAVSVGWLCITPTDEFPFWEAMSSALVTALVTGLTIWFSVSESRRATQKALEADQRARDEEEARRARARRSDDALAAVDAIVSRLWWGAIGRSETEPSIAREPGEVWYFGIARLLSSESEGASTIARWIESEFRLLYSGDMYDGSQPDDLRARRLAAPESLNEVVTTWARDGALTPSIEERLRANLERIASLSL
ncbi:hypothetical protein [Agromyces indicus]|uniref:hypothetical protein n=1 Tax=Agromyces indicus TaxID=758919 RepID=UPI00286DE01E|nr:hypothetical protein [Agromyces indicus]